MHLELIETAGLGDTSYVLHAKGEAVVVDPQRDVDRVLRVLAEGDLRLRAVLETHVHNDYVSGALELGRRTGAELLVPAGGGYRFDARAVGEGEALQAGGLRLVALATPGHTPEHLSYLVYEGEGEEPVAVFTGGSLMVGGAGRTDLLGPERTDELTRAQFRSLRRLAALPDAVRVLPTHGAGSFCGAGPAPTEPTSTIGEQRGGNPALKVPGEEAFVRRQLSGLLAHPDYYEAMAPINRAGPRPLAEVPAPRPLSPEAFAEAVASGATAVDARPRREFAAAHIEGSVNLELEDDFGSYAGWVLPFDGPLVLVLPDPEDGALEEAVTQLLRIGFEHAVGWLEGGIAAWEGSGRPLVSYPVAGLDEWCRAHREGRVPHLLDVRQRAEWDDGHVAGSRHVFVGDLPDRLEEVPRDGEVWVACASGHRASLAASLLHREGRAVRLIDGAGVEDFLERCGGDGGPGEAF